MKTIKKPRTIQMPDWMDVAVSERATINKRSVSGEIEFLVEEALRFVGASNTLSRPGYMDRNPAPGMADDLTGGRQ
jgi:hypothetical protein